MHLHCADGLVNDGTLAARDVKRDVHARQWREDVREQDDTVRPECSPWLQGHLHLHVMRPHKSCRITPSFSLSSSLNGRCTPRRTSCSMSCLLVGDLALHVKESLGELTARSAFSDRSLKDGCFLQRSMYACSCIKPSDDAPACRPCSSVRRPPSCTGPPAASSTLEAAPPSLLLGPSGAADLV